jgi:hypothetical protein
LLLMDELVTVRVFTSVPDAQVACTALLAAGLDASLRDEHLVSMQWLYSNAVGGVKLQVPAEQAEEARALLDTAAIVETPTPATDDEEACPECHSPQTESVLWGRQPAFLTWLVLGLPLFPVRRFRRCRRCGASLPSSGHSA